VTALDDRSSSSGPTRYRKSARTYTDHVIDYV
jgi:hypothetical protein